jgi:hypothetical protein
MATQPDGRTASKPSVRDVTCADNLLLFRSDKNVIKIKLNRLKRVDFCIIKDGV